MARKTTKRTKTARGGRAGHALRNEGQRQLLEVTDGVVKIAEAAGVTQPMATYWRKGSKLPGRERRERLAKAYKIPVDAWDQAPAKPKPKAKTRAKPKTKRRKPGTPVDVLAEAEASLEDIRERLEEDGLSTDARVRLLAERQRAIALIARLRERKEAREDRVVRGPVWSALRTKIFKALERHPDALRDVVDAFESVARGGSEVG